MHFLLSIELIVTQWDVNKKGVVALKNDISELIVTQWDVNLFILKYDTSGLQELIVTQWDVNGDEESEYIKRYLN